MPRIKHKERVLPRTHRAPEVLGDFKLQPSHRLMLELLLHYRYGTTELIGHAYNALRGRGLSAVRHELGRLYHAGYLERFYYSENPSGIGSSQFVYTLTPQGARAILSPDDYGAVRQQVYNRLRAKANVPHCLAISTLQLILDLGCSGPEILEFSADQEHQDTRVKVNLPPSGEEVVVWPDASALFQWPNGGRSLYLFEVERTHKNRQRTRRRIGAYASYLTENLEPLRQGRGIDGAVVVFVADTDRRCLLLRQAAEDTLGELGRQRRPMMLFWSMENWYQALAQRDPRLPDQRAVRRVLAPPKQILSQSTFVTFEGKLRPLFLSA